MIQEGLQIMIIGMSVVFGFLTLMVFTMNIAAAFIKKIAKYFPEAHEDKGSTGRSNENQEIAVAIAAIQAHAQLK